MPNRKFSLFLTLALVITSIALILRGSRLYLSDNISRWRAPKPATPASCFQPKESESNMNLLPEYYPTTDLDSTCSRVSTTYFDEFHTHAASYCDPNSQSNLTCFHRRSGFGGKIDSFCFGQGAALNVDEGKFQLDCSLRKFSEQEEMDGLLSFHRLPGYWYETGPAFVFSLAVDVHESKFQHAGTGKEMQEKVQESQPLEQNTTLGVPPPKTLLLIKREGEGNPWHCLMEILSTYLTFDILRMPGSSFGEDSPLFKYPGDSDDTQVVILDDRDDGPYFDLWTLFARRKPVRLDELLSDQSILSNLDDVNLIVPLAGSSNPLWQDDARNQQCTDSPILDVFSRRVRDFYGIQDSPVRDGDKPIVLTFVNRRDTRRLQNQRYLFSKLQKRNSHIKVQMIDFAAIPFSEQVRVARETDILVGVHGAGMTQSMFMHQRAGAVVEIQPDILDHNGFRNIAVMRGLGYYRTHAKRISPEEWREGEEEQENMGEENSEGEDTQPKSENTPLKTTGRAKRGGTNRGGRQINVEDSGEIPEIVDSGIMKREGWHGSDVDIEESRFFEVVEAAIMFMYQKGPWKYDIN